MRAPRSLLLGAVVIALSSCTALGGSAEETLTPLVTDAPVESTTPPATEPGSVVAPTSTSTTIAPTTSTTPVTSNTIVGPFPTSVPPGKCTAEAIRADFGTAPQAWLECAGAWAVTRIENCPADVECEGVDIFRWTNDGWVHRGMTYSLCVLMVDETGMPRSVNGQLLAGNTDCIEPIAYVNESATGSLQVGAKGERTRRLQRRLIDWKLLNDSADGYFGANTRNAVYDFQHLANIAPTGVADERTVRALGLVWP